MIILINDLHHTERELPDIAVGDTISAHQATRVWMELCGYSDCNECGILGEHGEQKGFDIVPMDGGSVFISPLDDDLKDMARARAASRKPLRRALRRSTFRG